MWLFIRGPKTTKGHSAQGPRVCSQIHQGGWKQWLEGIEHFRSCCSLPGENAPAERDAGEPVEAEDERDSEELVEAEDERAADEPSEAATLMGA